ncbi:hypothetical protein BH10BDE1_BH10BDE1_02780 [soil metagenome]
MRQRLFHFSLRGLFAIGLIVSMAACKSGSEVDTLVGAISDPSAIGNSALSFTPNNYDFGALAVGLSLDRTIVIRNITKVDLFMSSVTDASTHFSVVSDNCPRAPLSLVGGATCEAVVRFKPLQAGSQEMALLATYGTAAEASTYYTSTGSLKGKGISPLTFAGATSISPVTTKTITLNWSANSDAIAFLVYSVTGGLATLEKTILNIGGTVASTSVTGLTPSAAYTYRVRAVDVLGQSDDNVVDLAVTTDQVGTLTTAPHTASEGMTATLDLSGLCNDNDPVDVNVPAFTIASQTSANANPNCSIVGQNLSCTPAYKTGHASWSETIAIYCTVNESNTSTVNFALTVNDVNLPSEIGDITNQSGVLAGTAISPIDANAAADTQDDGDPYTYSCYYDTTVDGTVSTASPCSNLSGSAMAYSFNAGTGALTWTPGYVQGGYTYEFKMIATDGFTSASDLFSIQVIPAVPIIQHTTAGNRIFATDYLDQLAVLNVDFGNVRTGAASDAGMSYTCYYDNSVDGTVAATTPCSSLPGVANFATFMTDGVFAWTPSAAVFGPFEIKVTGTNAAGSASEIYIVDVRAPYSMTNLLSYWDAAFATLSGNGLNSPATTNFVNLTTGGVSYDGTLSNFGFTNSSGWTGDNGSTISTPATGPYRLAFDGTNDKVSFGTGINGQSSLLFDTWIRPANAAALGKVLIDNSDSSNHGFKLLQSRSVPGALELQVGQKSYYDEVMADSPAAYFRLDTYNDFFDATGTNGKSANSTGVSRTTGALASFGSDPDSATSFSNGWVTYPDSASLSITGNSTYEAWIKPTSVSGSTTIIHKDNHFTFALVGNTLTFAHSGNWSYANTNTGGPYGTLVTNVWQHVAVVHTVGVGYVFYLNGVQAGNAFPNAGAMADNASPLCIGSYSCASAYFPGAIDEVAIYPSALSNVRIAAHYAARNRPLCRTSSILSTSSWHHVSGLFDGVTGNLQLYVNGQQECTTTVAGAAISASPSALGLGADTSGGNAWSGEIGEFRVYSSATSTPIATNFVATSGKYSQYVPRTNMKLWLRADATSYTPPQTVAEWRDLSGNGFHVTQATAGARPTLTANAINTSMPAMIFDGTDDRLFNASWDGLSGATKASMFFVVKNANPALSKVFVSDTSSYLRLQTYQSTGNRWIFSTGTSGYDYYLISDSTVPTDTWQIVEIIFDGSLTGNANRSKFFVNGTQSTVDYRSQTVPATLGSAGAQTLNIGSWTDGGYNPPAGFAEAMIYRDALTSADRQRVERYLGAKYGITVP